jgi:hypothetical protein
MKAEQIAIELYRLLDDIDTLDDLCKDDAEMFRTLAMREVAKRFKYCTTDGQKVYLRSDV